MVSKKLSTKIIIFDNPEYRELISYQASVYHEVNFRRKSEYYSLINQYLDTTIMSHQFIAKFLQMLKKDKDDAKKILQSLKQLSNFSTDANLNNFSVLFRQISNNCSEALEFGFENDDSGISEEKFRNSIEKIYSQLKSY